MQLASEKSLSLFDFGGDYLSPPNSKWREVLAEVITSRSELLSEEARAEQLEKALGEGHIAIPEGEEDEQEIGAYKLASSMTIMTEEEFDREERENSVTLKEEDKVKKKKELLRWTLKWIGTLEEECMSPSQALQTPDWLFREFVKTLPKDSRKKRRKGFAVLSLTLEDYEHLKQNTD
eukprot:jgi/Bigna1/138138/aug1.43_g12846